MAMAICFFGITRSLSHTITSIRQNVLAPARSKGGVRVYSHFFTQERIVNSRSGEDGPANTEEYRLLESDWLRLEEPESCLALWDFDGLKMHGDFWNTGFSSLRNLVHQLHSLDQVTKAALDDGATTCLFCRPDLRYHDNLAGPIRVALDARKPLVQVPYWQPWTGLNDRFALCSGRDAIEAYGMRIRQAHQFCEQTSSPLHSERLLRYAIQNAGIPVRTIGARASRVRLDGSQRYEDFAPPLINLWKRRIRSGLAAMLPSRVR